MVRGERIQESGVQSLRDEVRFHRLLEDHGIPVPHVYQWINSLNAVVLERVPGKPDFDGVPEAHRDAVVDEYLQALARLHKLDTVPFIEAGVHQKPRGASASTRLESFRKSKDRPHPFMEFCLGWLERNSPPPSERQAAIVSDSGQFHHENGHLVAILDLEFGCLGDPMEDLTVWRMRDTIIPFGDFTKIYARYEELTGEKVDLETIKWMHFAATLGNELMFGRAVRDPLPETDLMTYMQWDSETNLHATEALAEFLEVDLPTIEVPEPRDIQTANTHRYLVQMMMRLRPDEEYVRNEIRRGFRTARHLQRVGEIGDALEAANLDDATRVIGRKLEHWREADAELERFVMADQATGAHDRELLWLFHRRNLRTHLALGPIGSKMVAHFPCQRFDGRPTVNTANFQA